MEALISGYGKLCFAKHFGSGKLSVVGEPCNRATEPQILGDALEIYVHAVRLQLYILTIRRGTTIFVTKENVPTKSIITSCLTIS